MSLMCGNFSFYTARCVASCNVCNVHIRSLRGRPFHVISVPNGGISFAPNLATCPRFACLAPIFNDKVVLFLLLHHLPIASCGVSPLRADIAPCFVSGRVGVCLRPARPRFGSCRFNDWSARGSKLATPPPPPPGHCLAGHSCLSGTAAVAGSVACVGRRPAGALSRLLQICDRFVGGSLA